MDTIPQTQGTNELQAPFSRQFEGLNLSSATSDIPPSNSPVFHNCDVSPDGAVIRRGGTRNIIRTNLDPVSNGRYYGDTVRTRGGSEYFVQFAGRDILVSLMRDNVTFANPQLVATVSKLNVFGVTPTSYCTIPTTAPYDRLLVLTPEHPIVQLSFLERTLTYTAGTSSAGLVDITTNAASNNDSAMWLDNTFSAYIITDAANNVYAVNSKTGKFNFRVVNATSLTPGQTIVLTVRQVTWQWWAEALHWEGADFNQSVSRVNVTDADQSVKVPPRLITDLNPLYKNSQSFGLYCFSSNRFDINGYTGPMTSPVGENDYGFSTGGRYVPVTGSKLQVSPFFVTFGAKTAAGGIGQANFFRYRELRFNGNTGAKPADCELYAGGVLLPWSNTFTTVGAWKTAAESFTSTERVLTFNSLASDANNVQQYFTLASVNSDVPYNSSIDIANVGSASLFGASAKRTWQLGLTSPGSIDGTYVRAYGIGAFVDYSKRQFHAVGCLFRDRIALLNPSTATDQLLLSETSDETVPGDFYQYFQVTDALLGVSTDPFTLNITNDSRERLTAIIGWQDSLFAFTNTNTYSIGGGQQFGGSDYSVNVVSTYGAFNQQCVLVTNLTLLFMNRFGVFDVAQKPNTSQYGATERSVKVRSLFNNDIVDASLDGLHWLRYNEQANKLYVGLGIGDDTLRTSRNLMLNITWEAWSTLSSATPFQMFPATQIFRYTVFIAALAPPLVVCALCADMPYHLDYATFTGAVSAYPFTFEAPSATYDAPADNRGILDLRIPQVPGVNSCVASGTTRINDFLVRADGLPTTTTVTPRNPAWDYPTLRQLYGNVANVQTYGVVTYASDPYAAYPVVGASALPAPLQLQVNSANGFANQPVPLAGGSVLVGVQYSSVYASPVFDLDSMGRLKRLRRLHLLFDTDVTRTLRYPGYPNVKVINAALVTLVSNYNTNVSQTSTELVSDALSLGSALEATRVLQTSIPLAGFGCDYQLYVSSVGAETFKLAAYEFDVQPQRDKRYQRAGVR